MFSRARLLLRSVLFRRRIEREMQDEMTEHLERTTARLVTRGLSPDEAHRAARREFGNVAYLQEEARDARGTGWVDGLIADSRFALRQFARKPATTLAMLVVLVAGLSLSTLVFTYIHAYATMPPPGVKLEDDLVRIRGSRTYGVGERGYRTFSEDELREYRKLAGSVFTAVAGWTDASTVLTVGGGADRARLEARTTFVTENYFSVVGVRPALGSGLPVAGADEPSTAAVAVIGHTAWQQLFAKRLDVIGSTITVNGVPVTIVGVAPEKFVGFPAFSRFQLWMPLAAKRVLLPDAVGEFRAVARLREGVTLAAASAATQAVAVRTTERVPEIRALEPAADVVPLLSSNSDPMSDRDVKLMSVSVGFLALLVLLVTCTNVSALLTGLATARRQEIAVRLSLGAARTRLVRQLLTESVSLSVAAGLTALGGVWLVLRAVTTFVPEMPFEVRTTWPATTFVFGVALTVGVLFGLSPALHATRLGLASVLRDSAATVATVRGRLQRGLVIAQIAFTQPLIVILTAVLLFVLAQLRPRELNELADRLVAVSLRPTSTITGSTPAAAKSRQQLRVAFRELHDELAGAPGVETVAIQWGSFPLGGAYVTHPDDRVAGVAQSALEVGGDQAGSGYLSALGMRLVRGRAFAPGEISSGHVRDGELPIIVDSHLARRVWPGADPIGRRLVTTDDSIATVRALVVVGLVDDPAAKSRRPGDEYRIYVPPDTTLAPLAVLVRTATLAQPLVPRLRDVVQRVTPDMVASLRTL
ncbi:MAG TPA: ABC transporter permease, partial [Gemmatimonadaceae bacterium]|nr:ABC transporter permease [Gemmatimonadaceae bacterium]